MRFTLLLLLAATPVAAETSACPAAHLVGPQLISIVQAATPAELKAAFAPAIAPDGVTRLVYACRLDALSPGRAADDALIAAIPTSALEPHVLYTFTYPDCLVPTPLSDIAGGRWLRQVAAAVIRRGRGFREFLMLSSIIESNADLSAQLPELNFELKSKAPAQYQQAFKRLPPEVRSQVIGLEELLPREPR